jgi:hypothetical protein
MLHLMRVGKNDELSATQPTAVPNAVTLLVQLIILRRGSADALLSRSAGISTRQLQLSV